VGQANGARERASDEKLREATTSRRIEIAMAGTAQARLSHPTSLIANGE
jgi:hypothetical protein